MSKDKTDINNNRSNYAVDKLQLTEVGPSSMSSIIEQHIHAIPHKAIMMIGEPGIGKTVIVNDMQSSGKYHVLTIRLVNEDEGTMIGYADPGKSEDTVKLRVVTRVKESVDYAKKNDKKLIVFFDEVNRAKEHMIKCVFNIIDMKRWGDLQLPSDTCFIAAINPPTANHKVRDVLSDAALRRRFVSYAVKADVGEYLTYASQHGIHQAVVDFLRSKPDSLYDYHAMDNGLPYACPASWDTVSDLVKWHITQGGTLTSVLNSIALQRIMVGVMGTAMTFDFLEFTEDMQKVFTPGSILYNYDNIRERVKGILASEFTEEDTDMDTSKLTRAASNLGKYLAYLIAEKGMQLHCTPEQAEERECSAKQRAKTNLQGKNLATFLLDCPSTIMQTMFSSFDAEVKTLKAVPGEVTKCLEVMAQLSNYDEYTQAVKRYTNVVQDMN